MSPLRHRRSPSGAGRPTSSIGHASPPRRLGRLRPPLPQRLMELLPGVDLRMVADRSRRPANGEGQ